MQVTQRIVHAPSLEPLMVTQGQGLGQHDLVEGVPAHGKRIGK